MHSTESPCLVLFVVMPLLFHQPQCQKERENSTEQTTDQVRPPFSEQVVLGKSVMRRMEGFQSISLRGNKNTLVAF